VQKKDRDCGDNTQRDEDEERDPHANRNQACRIGRKPSLQEQPSLRDA
jgi:hypothetical protein